MSHQRRHPKESGSIVLCYISCEVAKRHFETVSVQACLMFPVESESFYGAMGPLPSPIDCTQEDPKKNPVETFSSDAGLSSRPYFHRGAGLEEETARNDLLTFNVLFGWLPLCPLCIQVNTRFSIGLLVRTICHENDDCSHLCATTKYTEQGGHYVQCGFRCAHHF